MPPDCLKPPGLRAAKKERTRAALSDAALELVSRHGYEATTVDAIAAAAGVSVRTFHNYFPGKAAALAHLAADLVREYGDVLRDQPDTVTLAAALHGAWTEMIDRYRETEDRLRALIDAIESNPELRRYLEVTYPESYEHGITEIGRRLGVDPATSVVPIVVTGIAFSIAVTVTRMRDEPTFTDRATEDLLDEAFSALPHLVAQPSPSQN